MSLAVKKKEEPKSRWRKFIEDQALAAGFGAGGDIIGAASIRPYMKNYAGFEKATKENFPGYLEKFKSKYPQAMERAGNPQFSHISELEGVPFSPSYYEDVGPLNKYFAHVGKPLLEEKHLVNMPVIDDYTLLHELGHAEIENTPGLLRWIQRNSNAGGKIISAAMDPVKETGAWIKAAKHVPGREKLKLAKYAMSPLGTYLGKSLGVLGGAYFGAKSIYDLLSPEDQK